MFLDKTNLRVSISIAILLVLAFTGTGFLSSVYRRQKAALGERHYQAGRQLDARADVEGAVEEFRKALLYSPDKQEYAYSFAAALVSSGRLDEAESHIDQLLQSDPTNGALNLMRGRIANRRHELTKAIDFYERAVYEYWPPSQAEERRKARWELISLLDQGGRREEVVAELMAMYANAPADYALRLRIGSDLLKRGAISEGTQLFRDATRAMPRNGEAHYGLGQALLASGDFVSARHEFERALRLDSKNRAVSEVLQQTNTVIDLSPEMPSLTYAERFRRSQNLLRRVLNDLSPCSGTEDETQVSAAQQMLQDPAIRKDPDGALRMQTAAAQLWGRRLKLCGSKTVNDPTLAMALERIGNE